MIPGLCDDPDRFAARVYLALRTDCPCCTFVRGVALGFLLGTAVALAAAFLLPLF